MKFAAIALLFAGLAVAAPAVGQDVSPDSLEARAELHDRGIVVSCVGKKKNFENCRQNGECCSKYCSPTGVCAAR
ncbi:uncharacterized protein CTRU02_210667 [Colletotrichum truncatum]|uniref:Uncharacterized protein n=1 Tax=Colletotrichum truncatum TaxID=5467 RepID=A0ACC3YPM7_COLTU|nr:uncharacterized protein CTRU02_03839 [Colletotrichum truncatum]KAF6796861.1 hypothetical protein CTRU02_03839 [Colletotrichum truncatum]